MPVTLHSLTKRERLVESRSLKYLRRRANCTCDLHKLMSGPAAPGPPSHSRRQSRGLGSQPPRVPSVRACGRDTRRESHEQTRCTPGWSAAGRAGGGGGIPPSWGCARLGCSAPLPRPGGPAPLSASGRATATSPEWHYATSVLLGCRPAGSLISSQMAGAFFVFFEAEYYSVVRVQAGSFVHRLRVDSGCGFRVLAAVTSAAVTRGADAAPRFRSLRPRAWKLGRRAESRRRGTAVLVSIATAPPRPRGSSRLADVSWLLLFLKKAILTRTRRVSRLGSRRLFSRETAGRRTLGSCASKGLWPRGQATAFCGTGT